jgi:hypothetical protein
LFDSTAWTDNEAKNATETGLIPTTMSEGHFGHGIQYFLNVCASYLYSLENSEDEGEQTIKFDYQQPFGDWFADEPTKQCPRFDYNTPSILCQRDTYNCGFAAVANLFAFVNHLKDVDFQTSHMTKVNDAHYLLDHEKYSLIPFWEKAVLLLKEHHGPTYECECKLLLNIMRQEHYLLVNDLSKLYLSEMNAKKDDDIERLGKKIESDVDLILADFQADLKKRKKREEKVNFIVAFLKEMGSATSDAWVNLGCRKCHTSFESTQVFSLPTSTDTMKWSLIWETPNSVRKRKDLQKLLGNYFKQLTWYNFSDIVSWSYDDVQTCMVLICHAFHCPGVQCYFIQGMETWSKVDGDKLAEREEKKKYNRMVRRRKINQLNL